MQHILIVDEDTTFATVYAKALEPAGFIVSISPDARGALTVLKNTTSPVDIVITEILLPGRNGIKLIQDIRLKEAWMELPVYVLSTLEAADVGLAHALAETLGVRAYMTKQSTPPQTLVGILHGSHPTHDLNPQI